MRPATLFVVLAIFIDSAGFGLILPVAPNLIRALTGTDLASAAPIAGQLMIAYAAMQFLFAPVLGALSDRYGRRPVLIGSLAALTIDYVLMSLANSVVWLFVGRLIAGIAGATYPTANAAISDLYAAEERARYFGWIGAAWGLGFIVGPVIGGLLADLSLRAPFYAAAILAASNAALGLLVFRETLSPSLRRPFAVERANLLGAVRQLSHLPGLKILLAVIFFYQIAHDALPATWNFFAMRQFAWGAKEVAWSLAGTGLASIVVQGALIAPILRQLGERRAALLGFAAGTLSMLGYAFSSQGWMVFPFLVVGAFFGLVMPAIQSLLTRYVPPNAQGELQGAIAGIASISAILAPWIMTELFYRATRPGVATPFPGAPMLLAAVLFLLAAVLFLRGVVRLPAGRAAVG